MPAGGASEPEVLPPVAKRPRGRPRKHPLPPEGGVPKKDYEIGRGKPPVTHQFKSGQSGNPKGRPKGALAMKTIVDQAMNEKVTAKVGGRLVKMTKGQALIARLVERGLSGDISASRTLLQLIQKYEDPPDHTQHVEPDRPLSAEEMEVFARFMSRHSEPPSGEATS